MASPFKGRITSGMASPLPCSEDAVRFLRYITDPDHSVHITAAPGFRQVLIMGEPEEIVKAAEDFGNAEGVYFGINPVNLTPWSKDRVTDAHIVYRGWLFIDCDPLRKEPKSNSTEEEHEAARKMAWAIRERLTADGWGEPAMVDSGNGFHLYYAVDLPNDVESKKLIKMCLKALAIRHDQPDVKVDQACHDARRIAKMPGTWVRKGPHSEQRPHRISRIVHLPASAEVISKQSLELLASTVEPEKPTILKPTKGRQTIYQGKVGTGANPDRAYAEQALRGEVEKCQRASKGGLNNQLFASGAALGNFVGSGLLSKDEAAAALLGAIRSAGANDEWKDEDTLRRAIERGMESPRMPSGAGTAQRSTSPSPSPSPSQPGMPEPVTIQASSMPTKEVEWLWPGRIPLGKLTTIAGMPGLGKTFLLCDLVARVTSGSPWPDEKANDGRGSVLFISGEDDPGDTLIPRMMAAGADLHRVRFFSPWAGGVFSLKSLDLLDKAMNEADGEIRLVAIDPPTSFVAGCDDHRNAELRQLLTPLADWAANNRTAIVFITHLNKGGAVKADAASRVTGSIAWVAATRAAYLMARDPDDEDRRIFAVIKNNLAPEPPTLAYQLAGLEGGRGRLEWRGVVEATADQAVNSAGSSRLKEAERFLIRCFRTAREWEVGKLEEEAREEGISWITVRRAKEKLGFPRPRKCERADGATYWKMWVPDNWPHLGPITETEF